MASAAPARAPSLHPDNWLRAAENRLAQNGIESVRVEVLARDLGVSKGSFYWHFRDRGELLEKLLTRWEDAEIDWLNAEAAAGAATRWANFVARAVDADRMRLEVSLRAWARADERVAGRVAAVEKRKSRLIDVAQLICLGWLDRATRDRQFEGSGRNLGELLSEFILAASARGSARE
jgi:AcrR family transcriptional regulator